MKACSWGFLVLAFFGNACATVPKKTKVGEALHADLDASVIRAVLHEYAATFASDVDAAANRIAKEAPPAIVENATLWKSNATSAIYAAAFHEDPYVAAMDVRVLAAQQRRFLESDGGRQAFGAWQPVAAESARRLEARYDDVARALRKAHGFGADDRTQRNLDHWAKAHPITDIGFSRDPLALEYVGMLGQESYGGLAAVEKIQMQLTDLMNRLRLYAAFLPKQGRWQARIFFDEALSDPRLGPTLASLGTLTTEFGDITAFVNDVPQWVAGERAQVIADVERISQALMAQVSGERAAVMNEVDGKLATVFDAVRAERVTVLRAVREERELTLAQAESMLLEAGKDLVDYVFWRLVLLLGVLFAGVLLVLLAMRLLGFQRRSRTTQRPSTTPVAS